MKLKELVNKIDNDIVLWIVRVFVPMFGDLFL